MAVVTEPLLRWRPQKGGPVYGVNMVVDDADFDVDAATGDVYRRILRLEANTPRGGEFIFGAKGRMRSAQRFIGPQAGRVIPLVGPRITEEGFRWDFTPDHVPVVPGSISTPSLLTSGGNATASTSDTSAAFTPTANGLLLAGWSTNHGTTAHTYTFSNDHVGSGAWGAVQLGTALDSDAQRAAQAYSQTGATPGSGTITNTYTSAQPARKSWVIYEITGHDTSAPVSESNTNNTDVGTTLAVTLAAIAAGNITIGTMLSGGTPTGPSPTDASETELAQATSTGSNQFWCQVQYGADTSLDWSSLSDTHPHVGTAIEFAVAVAAGGAKPAIIRQAVPRASLR